MDARIELRKKDFKKTFDDPRRRREEQQVQIRKQNREARISAKRQQALADLASEDLTGLSLADVQTIPSIAKVLLSPNPLQQFEACQQFRRFLSIERNPPIQAVIDANVVPRFIEFLKDYNRPDLQFEAAWALTNIASGTQEQTRVVIDHGALPIFIDLLSSPKPDVREQAIWALGNIAGDCATLRDMVFSNGGLQPILAQLNDALSNRSQKGSMLRNAAWTLSNLCRAKPKPSWNWVLPALPVLRELIHTEDIHVLADACWALSYLTDGNEASSNESIDLVLQPDVAPRLVTLLVHSRDTVQTPALRTVGNIVSGSEKQTQTMLDANCLPALKFLLTSPRKHIRKEACWALSNVTAGTEAQIQQVIKEEIIPILIGMASPSVEFQIRREVFWALANAASGGTNSQIVYLVDCGIIAPMTEILRERSDLRMVASVLEGIFNILGTGKVIQEQTNADINPYVRRFEEAGGLNNLEHLQNEPEDSVVYKYALRIIKTFLSYDEEVGDLAQYDTYDATGQSGHQIDFQSNNMQG